MKTVTIKTTLEQDCTFNFPDLSKIQDDSNQIGDFSQAVFLDSDRNVYDKYYQPILKANSSENSTNDPSDDSKVNSLIECATKRNLGLVFPNPKFYRSKDDFLLALHNWKKNVTAFFDGFLLPQPILSHNYYLGHPSIVVKGTQQFRSFKPDLDPPIPINSQKLFDLLNIEYLNGTEHLYSQNHSNGNNQKEIERAIENFDEILKDENKIDEEAPFPAQTPHRNIVKIGHQMTTRQQWQDQLVPAEPFPDMYDTFEDYEKAYKKWAIVCLKKSLKSDVPPPSVFEKVARIDLIENTEVIENEIPVHKQSSQNDLQNDNTSDFFNVVDFGWVNQRKDEKTDVAKKLVANLFREETLENLRPKSFAGKPLSCFVDGISSKEKFITEFENFGVDLNTIKSNTPIRPLGFIETSPSADIEIQQCLKYVVDNNDPFVSIRQFLQIPFGPETLYRALSNSSSIVKIVETKQDNQNQNNQPNLSNSVLCQEMKSVPPPTVTTTSFEQAQPNSGNNDNNNSVFPVKLKPVAQNKANITKPSTFNPSDLNKKDDDDEKPLSFKSLIAFYKQQEQHSNDKNITNNRSNNIPMNLSRPNLNAPPHQELKQTQFNSSNTVYDAGNNIKSSLCPSRFNSNPISVEPPSPLNTDEVPSNIQIANRSRHRTIASNKMNKNINPLEEFPPECDFEYANVFVMPIDKYLQAYFTPKQLIRCLPRFEKEDIDVYRRVGFLAPFLMTDTFVDGILRIILEPDSIYSLYLFTKQVMVNQTHPIRTFYPPETETEFSINVSQLFYLDMLLYWKFLPFTMQAIIKMKCRELVTSITQDLSSNSPIVFTNSSVNQNDDPNRKPINARDYLWTNYEQSHLFEMIIEMGCVQVFSHILISNNENAASINTKFINLAKTEKGKRILVRLAYNQGSSAFSDFICLNGLNLNSLNYAQSHSQSSEPKSSNSETSFITEIYTIFLKQFLINYKNKLYDPTVFFPLFDQLQHIRVLIAASQVICRPDLEIPKNSFNQYPEICLKIGESNNPIEKIFLCLTHFCQFENCCVKLLNSSQFCGKLAKSLFSWENKIRQRGWLIMNQFLRFSSSLLALLDSEPIMQVVQTLPSSNNFFVVYELFSFLITLWGSHNNNSQICNHILENLDPCTGRLSCVIMNANSKYENCPNLRETIEKFKRLVFATMNPTLMKFATLLNTHMESQKVTAQLGGIEGRRKNI
ncbi:hypothetical protein TRFO_39758 [Tritrichomonas foetus]|uniref:Uncharacterized protein n=1 Tax=Tritrichomonas foetus TaxID=1144522 RepID=A0A1J4J9F7_9EUKA|nr:hypothetical protein TRFO_39758 [Tritrichomonas foetus]|eukprot:OHS94053.1 hypothetical protein TRFO_39758 [Tritrichomonas foetus]